MKRKLFGIIMSIILVFSISGCSNVMNPNDVLDSPNSRLVDFEIIDDNFYGFILVDKNTNVMYYWVGADVGGITPIYNADGTLKLYEN
ncbi:MAG: hypothetical protein II304_04320 [Bacteroidales bacterium]|jgi:hypothetical protein|nr:hypothetical protein [Bacteroidales bacterium]